MTSTAASMARPVPDTGENELSLTRLYVLRATYLLIAVGLGSVMIPALLSHEPTARGVIPSLLLGMGLLDLIGVRYPRQMLPLLLFEFAWKTTWMLAFGLPQWLSGQFPSTFPEDFRAIGFGVILMPVVIPWGYVWRHYLKARGDRWR
jgi:hypothetical protein